MGQVPLGARLGRRGGWDDAGGGLARGISPSTWRSRAGFQVLLQAPGWGWGGLGHEATPPAGAMPVPMPPPWCPLPPLAGHGELHGALAHRRGHLDDLHALDPLCNGQALGGARAAGPCPETLPHPAMATPGTSLPPPTCSHGNGPEGGPGAGPEPSAHRSGPDTGAGMGTAGGVPALCPIPNHMGAGQPPQSG